MNTPQQTANTGKFFINPGSNLIIYSVFLIYSVYFLLIHGTLMNSDGVYNSMRVFSSKREAWIIISYCVAFIYIAWAAFVFFKGRHSRASSVSRVFLTALAIRLVPAMIIYGANPDMRNFVLSQEAAAAGSWEIAVGRMPYLPFFSYILLALHKINSFFQLPAYFVIKLIPVLFDSLIAAALCRTAAGREKAMAYAWNPVTVLIFAGHGQFDSITLFFILVSLYLHNRTSVSGLSFGAAFQSKWWPFMLLPVYFFRLKPVKMLLFAASWTCVFLVFSAPYLKLDPALLLIPFKYSGIARDYGISGLAHYVTMRLMHADPQVFSSVLTVIKTLCGIAIIWAAVISRKGTVVKSAFFVILTFYILCPGWSIQYFSWLVVFMFLTGTEKIPFMKNVFLLAFTIYFTVVLYNVPSFFRFSQVDLRNAYSIISFMLSVSALPVWYKIYKEIKSGE